MADVFVPAGTTNLGGLSIDNNDTVIFAEGSQHVTSGLNLTTVASGLTIEAGPGFTGSVGGASGSLRFDGATLNWKAGGGELHIQPTSAQNYNIVGGARVEIKGGGTVNTLDTACPFTRVTEDVAVGNIKKRGGDMVVSHNSTKLQSIRAAGGSLTCERGLSGVAILADSQTIIGRLQSQLSAPAIDGSLFTVVAGLLDFRTLSASTIGLQAHNTRINAGKVQNALTLSGDIDAASAYRSNLASAFASVTIANLDEYGGDSDEDFGFSGDKT